MLIRFFKGAFLELLINSAVSMRSYKIYSVLTSKDVASLVLATVCLFALAVFLVFVTYSSFTVANKISLYYKNDLRSRNEEKIESIQKSFVQKQQSKRQYRRKSLVIRQSITKNILEQ